MLADPPVELHPLFPAVGPVREKVKVAVLLAGLGSGVDELAVAVKVALSKALGTLKVLWTV